MTIGFDRPIGAAADVAELEYISALMQTQMPNLRLDGSIREEDIVLFLSSRYGIKVSPGEIRKVVMKGLGGGDGDDVCIDLMELVAMLLIPTLLKAAANCDTNSADNEANGTDAYCEEAEEEGCSTTSDIEKSDPTNQETEEDVINSADSTAIRADIISSTNRAEEDVMGNNDCFLLAIGAQHRSLASRIAHNLCSSSVTHVLREPAGLPS